MDYLFDYVSEEDFKVIRFNMSSRERNNFGLYEHNIRGILDYLKSIGVVNFKGILLYRKDICFKNIDVLKDEVNKINSKLMVYLFNNDVSNLINLNI